MSELLESVIGLIDELIPIGIVEPNEMGVYVFCGKKIAVVKPRLYFALPLICSVEVLDVTDQVVDIRSQTVTTSDGVTVAVSGAVSYSILNIEKALYAVQDVDVSLPNLCLGIIAHYVNGHTFEDCCNIGDMSNELLKEIRGEATDKWGLKILRTWITDFAKCDVHRVITDEGSNVVFMGE